MRKSILALALTVTVAAGSFLAGLGSTEVKAAEAKTGVGLSEHVMMAYNDGWKYNYGSYGQLRSGKRYTDCSGLIKSYLWWTGEKSNPNPNLLSVPGTGSGMLSASKSKGTIDYKKTSSLPRIHGLILHQPGHVGVYVGNNMAVDNRDVGYDVMYEKVFGRAKPKWTTWFKLNQISYPTTGFVTFESDTYYYEDGQYVVDTSRTIDDTVYTFNAAGVMTAKALTEQAQVAALSNDVVKADDGTAVIAGSPAAQQLDLGAALASVTLK